MIYRYASQVHYEDNDALASSGPLKQHHGIHEASPVISQEDVHDDPALMNRTSNVACQLSYVTIT